MTRISKDKLIELIGKAQSGDKVAIEELVEGNRGLVLKAVSKYKSLGNDLEDLIQVGNIGLIKAIQGFDASYDVEFSTYAFPTIEGTIKRYFRDNFSLLKVSRKIQEKLRLVEEKKKEYEKQYKRVPSSKELSEILGMDESELNMVLASRQSPVSMEEIICDGNNQNPVTREQSIAANEYWEQDEDTYVLKIELRKAMKDLNEKEKKIIRLKYYEGLSQSKIGDILNMSQAQVSRTERKILNSLKNKLKVSNL